MKSIEERAKEYVSKKHIDCGNCDTCVKCPDYWAYISIAKEQKAIDDADLLKLKSSWEKEAQINHDDEANYRQGYHDAAEKACKLIDNYIADLAYPVAWVDAKLLISIPERLRKAMEE